MIRLLLSTVAATGYLSKLRDEPNHLWKSLENGIRYAGEDGRRAGQLSLCGTARSVITADGTG